MKNIINPIYPRYPGVVMAVKIYTTPTCPYCIMAKRFFQENKVKYEEFDVSSSEEALSEMIHKSGQQGVPVIDVGGKIIIGFDKDEIAISLKAGKPAKKK